MLPLDTVAWRDLYLAERGYAPTSAEHLRAFANNRGGMISWVEARRLVEASAEVLAPRRASTNQAASTAATGSISPRSWRQEPPHVVHADAFVALQAASTAATGSSSPRSWRQEPPHADETWRQEIPDGSRPRRAGSSIGIARRVGSVVLISHRISDGPQLLRTSPQLDSRIRHLFEMLLRQHLPRHMDRTEVFANLFTSFRRDVQANPNVAVLRLIASLDQMGSVAARDRAERLLDVLPVATLVDPAFADTRECSICLDDEGDEGDWRVLPCKHVFHKECLREWFCQWLHQNSCPLCRLELDNIIDDLEIPSPDAEALPVAQAVPVPEVEVVPVAQAVFVPESRHRIRVPPLVLPARWSTGREPQGYLSRIREDGNGQTPRRPPRPVRHSYPSSSRRPDTPPFPARSSPDPAHWQTAQRQTTQPHRRDLLRNGHRTSIASGTHSGSTREQLQWSGTPSGLDPVFRYSF